MNCISVKDKFYENGLTDGKLQQLYSKNKFIVCKVKCMHDATMFRDLQFHCEKKHLHTSSFEGQCHTGIHDRCTCTQLSKTNKCQSREGDFFAIQNVIQHSIKSCVQINR